MRFALYAHRCTKKIKGARLRALVLPLIFLVWRCIMESTTGQQSQNYPNFAKFLFSEVYSVIFKVPPYY